MVLKIYCNTHFVLYPVSILFLNLLFAASALASSSPSRRKPEDKDLLVYGREPSA